MSEQKISYMSQLDSWIEQEIFVALGAAYMSGRPDAVVDTQDDIRSALHKKVLESYRNGQAAGPRKVFKRS